MLKLIIPLTILFFLTSLKLNAQEEPKKYEIGGYLTNMQSVQFEDVKGVWLNDNLVHNRINFSWFPNDKWTFKFGLRNRIFTGETLKAFPEYAEFIEASELGYMDLNWNIISEQSVILNSTIDRLFLQYVKGDFSATVGRQRINWGKTFVWNPNDLFNSYSYFDFDYPEKPGSDAIRLEYYTSYASSIELSGKIDRNDDLTVAGLWRFNKWNYDFQLLGGVLNSNEYAVGAGWSGAIKKLDFKGELTYLHPIENINDTTGQFLASISTGYSFPNTLSLMFEFLYTDIPENGIKNFSEYYLNPLSVKTLSFTEYNIFGSVRYQITPLLTGSFSCMYYPKINGFYIGPSIDYSFSDNLFASIVVQTFSGDMENPISLETERMNITYAFLRMKWSF